MISRVRIPSHEELKTLKADFTYDSVSGSITRIVRCRQNVRGEQTKKYKTGYIKIKSCRRTFRGHSIAWYLHYGVWPEMSLDHINGIRSDNRICNLRLATPAQNARNRRHTSFDRKKGITFLKSINKWQAQISMDNKKIYLGCFDTQESAHQAYLSASAIHGDFANSGDGPALGDGR